MIIKALKTFSDGAISLHEGEIANVPDVKAQLFINAGYAVEYTGEGGDIDLSAYAKKTDVEKTAFDVAKSIDGVEEVEKYENVEITLNSGYINITTGAISESTTSKNATLSVQAGEKYEISGCYNYYVALYAFYDVNGTKIFTYPNTVQSQQTTETVNIEIPNGVSTLKVSSFNNIEPQVKKASENVGLKVSIPEAEIHKANVLYGKKWCTCGDSFTAGDFNGYSGNDHIDENGVVKTYPWWIAKRNDMTEVRLAQAGNDFTNVEDAVRPFSDTATTINYTKIPTDCDYVTLWFGLNEGTLTDEQIGTKTDTDNTTLWGAYNVVLEDILTKNPTVKIGIIITDGSLPKKYHDALIEIAQYWGVKYLDLRDGNTPMLMRGKLSDHSSVAETLRQNAFRVSETNGHPNVKAHEYRSTIIEDFLRSL